MKTILPGQLWKFEFRYKQPTYLLVTSIIGDIVNYYYLNNDYNGVVWATKEDFLHAYKLVSG